MEQGHHHHQSSGKNLIYTIILNFIISVAQIIGGLISGSMALLSDAAHNFSDVLALVISFIAQKIGKRKRTEVQTFGYKRAEIFAAFINAATLIGIAVSLLIGAMEHLINPKPIMGNIVIYLAALSILINGLSVLLIKKDAAHSMNIKSAYLHLFTDMLTSMAVLAGGFAMKYLQWYWIDGVLSLLIAVYLIYNSWDIFKDSVKIFMQFCPDSIDIQNIVEDISKISGIKNTHHIHVWQLDEHDIMFEGHIDTEDDILISQFEKILQEIQQILEQKGIHHHIIQPEFTIQDNKSIIN